MKRVILSAFNVHVGGGLVLLKSLILSKYIKINILDLRVKKKIKDLKLLNALYIKRKIFSRLFWFHLVSWKSKKNDVILCFNGLPPIFKVKAKVIIFIQTFYFFGDVKKFGFNKFTYLRIIFEKIWFYLGVKNVDEFWVQTITMKNRLIKKLKDLKIYKYKINVMPLLDEQSLNYFNNSKKIIFRKKNKQNFIYPADYAAHKNHLRLMKAFDKVNMNFKLYLTLPKKDFNHLLEASNISTSTRKKILNLGFLSRDKVLKIYQTKIGTLIFPSADESFGIPIIEAYMFKKNILISNKPYAKDLVSDVIFFDPFSVNSIRNAIINFLNSDKILKTKFKKIKFANSYKFITKTFN